MVKLEFKNVVVKDDGYGMEVNGKSLAEIISTALGTKIGAKKAGYSGELPSFKSNSCDVTVIISPHKVVESIEDDDNVYNSLNELEEEKANEFKEKTAKADTEE